MNKTPLAWAIDQNIQEARLKPVGELVIGEPAVAATPTKASNSGSFDIAATYQSVCSACHATATVGAPVFGDQDAWQTRLDAKDGLEGLYQSGLNGVPGTAMTAKGGSTLTDEQFYQMVVYMLNEAKVSY